MNFTSNKQLSMIAKSAVALALVAGTSISAGAQSTAAQKIVTASPAAAVPVLRAAPGRAISSAAWAMPDAERLIEQVFTRIVTQDKPAAIPMLDYQTRTLGRKETIEAVRRFSGQSLENSPIAFRSVASWTDTRREDFKPCFGDGCEAPVNSLWLAVTKIERGELPHELHVWYTTSFAAKGPTGTPDAQTYSFCERWLRVNGVWKYDGFVRVTY